MEYLITVLFLLAPKPSTPSDIWHDPNALALMGIGAGILGALATIAMGFYAVRQGRMKRKLEYNIVSDTPIVTVDSTVSGSIQILFNGQPAKDARIVVITVRNAGNSSIRKEDYFKPVSLNFESDVLSAYISSTKPEPLLDPNEKKNFLVINQQSVIFPQFPLNRNDMLKVTILLKGKSDLKVIGSIDQGLVTAYKSSLGIAGTLLLIALASLGLFGVIDFLFPSAAILPYIAVIAGFGTTLIVVGLLPYTLYRILTGKDKLTYP